MTKEVKLEKGKNYIEIILESSSFLMVDNTLAQVQISKIRIEGTNFGGAMECIKCPDGFYSSGNQSTCNKCAIGSMASQDSKLDFYCYFSQQKQDVFHV